MNEGKEKLQMSKEPHAGGILDKYPYADKRDVVGRVVCILDARSENRGMELSIHPSRAVPKGKVHELVATDDPQAKPGQVVDRVAYIGFFEVEEGGIILVNDQVTVEGQELGQVVGFDFTHAPNHLNILIRTAALMTGPELGLKLGGRVVFSMQVQSQDI
jgi:uncharacterized protein YuzE